MNPYIFHNLEFFSLLLPAILLMWISKRINPYFFKSTILLASIFFIAALPEIKARYFLFLAIYMLAIFIIAKIFLIFKEQHAKLLTAILFIIILIFSVIKFENLMSFILSSFQLEHTKIMGIFPVFGFGFLVIKSYSLLVDIYSRRIQSLNLLDFSLYCLYFATFLSGPIEKYSAFTNQVTNASKDFNDWRRINQDLPRFIIGLFKVNVIAGLLQPYAIPFLTDTQLLNIKYLYVGVIAYYWYEYVNFSGYSDMAISFSRSIGIGLAENFNYPFLACSLTELWRRWHISFATWLRDYIYYPLMYALTKYFCFIPKKYQVFISGIAIFITFVLCGLWHGDTFGIILFGILSGFVLALEAIYTNLFAKKIHLWKKEIPWLIRSSTIINQFLTFHVASFTFAPVLLSNKQLAIIFNKFGSYIL